MTVIVETAWSPDFGAALGGSTSTGKIPKTSGSGAWLLAFRAGHAALGDGQGTTPARAGTHTQALPRGHELFIETSALGQRPRRLS